MEFSSDCELHGKLNRESEIMLLIVREKETNYSGGVGYSCGTVA